MKKTTLYSLILCVWFVSDLAYAQKKTLKEQDIEVISDKIASQVAVGLCECFHNYAWSNLNQEGQNFMLSLKNKSTPEIKQILKELSEDDTMEELGEHLATWLQSLENNQDLKNCQITAAMNAKYANKKMLKDKNIAETELINIEENIIKYTKERCEILKIFFQFNELSDEED